MRHPRVRVPGHATVVAYLALFFALSGTAYAAATIGSAEVRDNSLQSVDIKDGTLTSADVKDGALISADLKDGAAAKGVDVVDNSLTGDDVNEATLGGVAHRVLLDAEPSTADQVAMTAIGAAGPWTVKATCDGRSNSVVATLFARGPAGEARGDFTSFVNDNPETVRFGALSTDITASTDTSFLTVTSNTQFVRASTNLWLHAGSTVAQLQLQVIADVRPGSAGCLVLGTLVVAV